MIIDTLVQLPRPEQQDGGLGRPTTRGHRAGLESENDRELSRRRIFEFRMRSERFCPSPSLFLLVFIASLLSRMKYTRGLCAFLSLYGDTYNP